MLAAAVLFVLWLARGVIAPFVVAALIGYAFSPLVSAAEARTRLPRLLIVAIAYVVTFVAAGAVVMVVWQRASAELHDLSATGTGDIIANALRRIAGDQVTIAGQTITVDAASKAIHDAIFGAVATPGDAIHIVERSVEFALQALLTLIVAFYLLLDGDRFVAYSLRFLDRRRRVRTIRIGQRIHLVLGRWLRGQLLLIALVAVVLYVILGPVLHVPYALAISILSGVLEVIPLVGPIVATVLAVTVAFGSHGTDVALAVLVVYFVVRQVEDQLVMPIVIGRAVHLHPVVTIFAVLVGLSAFGVLGGLLGVPVAAAVNVTVNALYLDASATTEDRRAVSAARRTRASSSRRGTEEAGAGE